MADRQTRYAAEKAHDEGRHGDPEKADLLRYWAKVCPDCAFILRRDYRQERGRP